MRSVTVGPSVKIWVSPGCDSGEVCRGEKRGDSVVSILILRMSAGLQLKWLCCQLLL